MDRYPMPSGLAGLSLLGKFGTSFSKLNGIFSSSHGAASLMPISLSFSVYARQVFLTASVQNAPKGVVLKAHCSLDPAYPPSVVANRIGVVSKILPLPRVMLPSELASIP